MNSRIYKTIGLGGTFDHFHAGHEAFITFASQLASELLIGLTHPKLTMSKPYAHLIEPYDVRRRQVQLFCQRHGIKHRITELTDPIGPTLEKTAVRALAVTNETEAGAIQINTLRQKLGLRPLPVHVTPLIKDETGQDIHSVRIRAGEITREGEVYKALFDQDLELGPDQRQFFAQPQGKLIDLTRFTSQPKKQTLVAVVGDSSLETFLNEKWTHTLGIFDKKRAREKFESAVIDQLVSSTVANPAGIITVQLIESLQNALTQKKSYLFVEGEEDLAAVALVLLAPLESLVYYGQPNQGIVELRVTEELKKTFYHALKNTNLSQK
ncbi:MAG TPA: pantetheine-phosphate adenylyltransferase [Vitreimonas sp.]|nr:pantetheine-phosphate adenylyltransferase [Vitreimonas sp.]